jgi:HD-like signal output (HDOD) protein
VKTHEFNTQIAKLKSIPPLSKTGNLIVAAVNDPEISIEDLVNILITSPVLVGRLLGLANSAYFGRAGQIDDLRIAIIQVLGLNLVKSLALSIVLDAQLDTRNCKNFNSDRFWTNALLTAILAQNLSLVTHGKKYDYSLPYTAGLLQNIGLMAAIYLVPKEMDTLFVNSDESDLPLSDHMQQQFGVDQFYLGFLLLERWKLPEAYQLLLKQYNNNNYQGEHLALIKMIKFCSNIASHVYYGKEVDKLILSDQLEELQISETQLKQVLDDILEKLEELKELAFTISGK